MNFHKCLLVLLLIAFSITECAKYKAIPLSYISFNEDQRKNCISFNYKVFNSADCKRYLGRRKLISKGYQPIQISINNNSDRCVSINLKDFSFPCASVNNVLEVIHFNMVARVVGYSIGAVFCWPFVIGAIVEGVQTPEANLNMDADYFHKSLSSQVIKPFSSINKVIFVANEQFDSAFSFKIKDVERNCELDLSTSVKQLSI